MNIQLAAMEEEKFKSMTKKMGKWMDQVLTGYHKYCPDQAWSPAINLYEDQEGYSVVADLAGIKAEEVDLQVENNGLVLSGNRETPGLAEAKDTTRLHLMEIDHGRFCRTIEIPGDVDVDKISATYRNGFLWVSLPKK